MVEDIWLPPAIDIDSERRWLQSALFNWLEKEFSEEALHPEIAARAAQIYARQRMEGENLLMSIHVALLAEMRLFNFGMTACSEFVVANAVADLLIARLQEQR